MNILSTGAIGHIGSKIIIKLKKIKKAKQAYDKERAKSKK